MWISTSEAAQRFAFIGVLFAAFAFKAGAQEQPPVANNSQDEEINFDKTLDKDTDTFRILRSGDKLELNRYVTKVYPLRHANPFELVPYLQGIVGLEKGTVNTARNPGPDGRMRMWIQVNAPSFLIPYLDQAVAAYDVPNFTSAPGFVAFAYRTQHRSAQEVADFVRISSGTAEGKVVADPITNTIYFQESPSDFIRVFGSILFVDLPVPQIELELMSIELTDVDQTSLGLYWDAWKTSLRGDTSFDFSDTRIDDGSDVANTSFRDFSTFTSLNATTLARFLNYLVDQGAAEVLVETQLTAGNGETAVIDSRTGVPEFNFVVNKETGFSELTRVANRNEGVVIRITPVVAMESTRLDVEIETHSPVAIDKIDNPIFSDQVYRTNLTVSQDQLYKIGGMNRGVTATETRGFPGLKSIPGLKWLFSNEVNVIRGTKFFVFIRPSWTAPLLPDASWKDLHNIVEAFSIDDLLKENPNLRMSPTDAEMLQRYFDYRGEEPGDVVGRTGDAPAPSALPRR